LRLIFLWFGSWKNGESTYTPLWVKKNQKQYPLYLAESGQVITYLSVFKEANWKADANAFAALMRHIREVDGDAHTVIMMQVENEVGCPGGTRDQVPEAKAAFNAPVPRQLMDYMVKNKENLVSEFRQYWEAAGGKTAGTWAEVFGNQPMTNEIFMAWYFKQLGIINWIRRCREDRDEDGRFVLRQETNAYAILPISQWNGYVDAETTQPPHPTAWGAYPPLPSVVEEALTTAQNGGCMMAVVTRLEDDPRDTVAAALASLGRALGLN
jgi:hypothetical protein